MTIQALEREVLELPPRSRIRFVEKIIESVNDYADSKIERRGQTKLAGASRKSNPAQPRESPPEQQ